MLDKLRETSLHLSKEPQTTQAPVQGGGTGGILLSLGGIGLAAGDSSSREDHEE